MARPRKPAAPPASELSPSRVVVSYPPSTWLARLKEELILGGIEHDRAGLIARRVVSALVPQPARLEAMDRGGDRLEEE